MLLFTKTKAVETMNIWNCKVKVEIDGHVVVRLGGLIGRVEPMMMMMMPFICSYRNKNYPTVIYPSSGYSGQSGARNSHWVGRRSVLKHIMGHHIRFTILSQ